MNFYEEMFVSISFFLMRKELRLEYTNISQNTWR